MFNCPRKMPQLSIQRLKNSIYFKNLLFVHMRELYSRELCQYCNKHENSSTNSKVGYIIRNKCIIIFYILQHRVNLLIKNQIIKYVTCYIYLNRQTYKVKILYCISKKKQL